MSLFGNKPPAKTVLLLDIESGSVGSALAQLQAGEAPRLFAMQRTRTPVFDARSALALLRAVEHATHDALLHAAEFGTRLRVGQAPLGAVEGVVVFLSAPWGTPNFALGRPDFSQALVESLAPRAQALFEAPVTMHAHASAALHGLRALYPHAQEALVASVGGEITELLLVESGRAVGHGTLPVGLNTVLRTLKSHAGLSEHEAHSALKLGTVNEATSSAAGHFAEEIAAAASKLLSGSQPSEVFVLAHEPGAQWFAKALSGPALASLFPQGGVVRPMHGAHMAPYVASAGIPDAHLALDALYTAAAH